MARVIVYQFYGFTSPRGERITPDAVCPRCKQKKGVAYYSHESSDGMLIVEPLCLTCAGALNKPKSTK